MTYHERVQAIAEEIAKEMHPKKPQAGFTYEQLSLHYLPAAHIAVKHMAESFKKAAERFDISGLETDESIQEYLKEQGLIPDKDKY